MPRLGTIIALQCNENQNALLLWQNKKSKLS